MTTDIDALNHCAQEYSREIGRVRQEIGKVIIGQEETVEKTLVAFFSGGHVLIEGVPGIAKTLLISTLAHCLGCSFGRIQFTPDLLPSDILGTHIFNQSQASFYAIKGPIFHNIILADEINRAPPKVQSALLEAMQEQQVTLQGETFTLGKPFFVLATQNPIESEGTYPLPEAQVDRFMLKIVMTYPDVDDEVRILDRFTGGEPARPEMIMSVQKILDIQAFARSVYADQKVKRYAAEIVDATRNPSRYGLDTGPYLSYGASPRASLYLVLGAKTRALMDGRGYVLPEDIRAVASETLRHRILLSYEAEAEGITSQAIIGSILKTVTVP
jgi:MoxR-like ATPase